MVIELVQYKISLELIQALETMLVDARAGKMLGIAYIAMYSHIDYVIDVAGETKRSPIITRGILPELDYELGKIIRGE